MPPFPWTITVGNSSWRKGRTRIMSHPPGTLRFRIFSFHATHDIPRRAHNSFFSSVPSNLPIFSDPCNLTGWCLLSGYANNDARRKPVRSRRADRREREKARERERERESGQKRMQRNSYCSLSHDAIVYSRRGWMRGRARRGTAAKSAAGG